MTEGGQPGGCFPWPGVWAFPEELGATSWGDPGDTEDLLLTPWQRAIWVSIGAVAPCPVPGRQWIEMRRGLPQGGGG